MFFNKFMNVLTITQKIFLIDINKEYIASNEMTL